MATVKNQTIDWAAASQAVPGQEVCGDMYLVKLLPQGALVAAVDGLGHGQAAAEAARTALQIIESSAHESLITIIQRCHDELRPTRGAVMALASFNVRDHTMTWLGVGNVEGYLLHHDALYPGQEGMVLRPGVVGDSLPRLAASIVQVGEGDVLIFATDGIRPGFADNINLGDSPQQIADRIMALFNRGSDDAMVLVVRYAYGQESETL